MGKRNVVIYANDDLVRWAKSKGYNLSELFNNMLQGMSEHEGNIIPNKEEINKQIIEHQVEINRLKAEKIEQEKRKQNVIENVEY